MLTSRVSRQFHHQWRVDQATVLAKAENHKELGKENKVRQSSRRLFQAWKFARAIASGISGAITSSKDSALAQVIGDSSPHIQNREGDDFCANPDRSNSSTIQLSKTPTLIEVQG